jgi:hypothetical protein
MYKYKVSLLVKSNSGTRTVMVDVVHEEQWLSGGDKDLKLEIIKKAAVDNSIDVETVDFSDSRTTIDVGYGSFGLSTPEKVESNEASIEKKKPTAKKKSKGSKLWRIFKMIISFGMSNGDSITDAKDVLDND